MCELAALEWEDLNFESGLLSINKSLQHLPGKGIFVKPPKNQTSNRIISLPKTVINFLLEYKVWQNGEKAKLDVTTVSKRLGHARTSTTTDIYSHSLRKADSEAADKLENLFNTKSIKTQKQI